MNAIILNVELSAGMRDKHQDVSHPFAHVRSAHDMYDDPRFAILLVLFPDVPEFDLPCCELRRSNPDVDAPIPDVLRSVGWDLDRHAQVGSSANRRTMRREAATAQNGLTAIYHSLHSHTFAKHVSLKQTYIADPTVLIHRETHSASMMQGGGPPSHL